MDGQNWSGIALYFVAFLVLFYVLIIMPRRRQDKKHKELLEALAAGDKIVTIGGIKGKVTRVKDDSVFVKVNDSMEIEFLKRAIAYKETEE